MAKRRIKIPKEASVGEVVGIKTSISHKMESGQRKDKEGNTIPRLIINSFKCEFNGAAVFSCDMEPGVAANPYFAFNAKINEAGTFKFTWVDDGGEVYEEEREIAIS